VGQVARGVDMAPTREVAPLIRHLANHEGHDMSFGGLLASVVDCFARRETRETFAGMARGVLMELEDVNCWSLAESDR
jgi:hypothetical protein